MNQVHEHEECSPDKSFIWKILTGVLAFVSMLCVTLAILPYNSLLKADDSCLTQIKEVKSEVKQNCVAVEVHNARIQSLENNRQETKQQLDNIERLLVKTATIVEELSKRFENREKKLSYNKDTIGLSKDN